MNVKEPYSYVFSSIPLFLSVLIGYIFSVCHMPQYITMSIFKLFILTKSF